MPVGDEEGRCLAVECAPGAMEAVRAAVIDGYSRLVRGGLEVGGLLLGRRDGETLHVTDSRPIPCQYAYGPTFTLSDNDLAGLAKLLEESSSGSKSHGLVPVGWYHSHTRRNLELSRRDLELHNRWFPKAWQVALVLRPEWKKPTKAAFYARDAEGLLRQAPEFVVEPAADVCRTILTAPAVELAPPSFTQSPARAAGQSRRWWLWLAAACSMAGVSSTVVLRNHWFPRSPAALQVALHDAGGQLAIRWDREVEAIREAEGGVLEIQDGLRKRVLEMSGPELRGADVVVSRQSGRVTVRLQARLPRGRTAEGWATFEGEPVKAANERE